MNFGAFITNGANSANPRFLNELEEAWHDEPFSAALDAPGALAEGATITCDSRDGPDSKGLAQLESRPGRDVEVALPLIDQVAA